jgi:NADH-quinone oxidoreductase subunit J
LVLSTVAGKGNVVGLGEGILGDVDSIAMLLFTRYILPFEIASVLLLVGIIGAVVLARRKPETGKA